MATDPQSLKIIAKWLSRLSALTGAGNDSAMSPEKLTDLAVMLGGEFPSPAFTSDSLQAIAAEDGWFPTYAVLRVRIERWWGERRPRQRQIAGPSGAEHLDERDASWLAYWYMRSAQITAGHAEDANGVAKDPYAGRGSAEAARRNLASLVRQKSPAAWRAISGSDGSVRGEPTDAEREAVSASVQQALDAMAEQREAVPRAAPVGEQLAAVRTAMGAASQARPLAPEQLALARAQQIPKQPPPF